MGYYIDLTFNLQNNVTPVKHSRIMTIFVKLNYMKITILVRFQIYKEKTNFDIWTKIYIGLPPVFLDNIL